MKIALPAGSQVAENYLEMAKENGFDWFDVGGSSPQNFPESFNPPRVEKLRAKLEEYGLGCGIHTASYVNTAEIAEPVRKGVVAHMKEFIDLAHGLGGMEPSGARATGAGNRSVTTLHDRHTGVCRVCCLRSGRRVARDPRPRAGPDQEVIHGNRNLYRSALCGGQLVTP